MENQHRLITGYRELSEAEIALMNEVKAEGERLSDLVSRVQDHLEVVGSTGTIDVSTPHNPYRWAAIAATDFQTGLMALTRAVARPESF